MIEPDEKEDLQSLLNKPAVLVPLVVVLLLVLIGAVVVVVKNAGKVQVGPAPVVLGPIPTDTTMAGSREQLRRGIERLEKRLNEYRQMADTLTPYQDSLFTLCSAELARLWNAFAQVEDASTYAIRKERFSKTREAYVQLREKVSDFVRSVDSTVSKIGLDSLDKELEKLIK